MTWIVSAEYVDYLKAKRRACAPLAPDPLPYQQSGADSVPYAKIEPVPINYRREIRPGVWVDVYDVLVAWHVTNPADAHAIKKLLMPGQRGAKSAEQDRREAIAAIYRAIELEGGA